MNRDLLATTDLSMPQIVERSGFASSSKLAISFRKETGLTATDYRRQFRPGA